MSETGGAIVESKPVEITTVQLEASALKAAGQLNAISKSYPKTAGVLFAGELIPDEIPDDPDGIIARELTTDSYEGKANGNAQNMLAAIKEGRRPDINLTRVNEGLEQLVRLTINPDPRVLRNHVLAVINATHKRLEQLRIKGSKSLELEKLEEDALEARKELSVPILPK